MGKKGPSKILLPLRNEKPLWPANKTAKTLGQGRKRKREEETVLLAWGYTMVVERSKSESSTEDEWSDWGTETDFSHKRTQSTLSKMNEKNGGLQSCWHVITDDEPQRRRF